jgi:glutathione synthase/RimK-type ligase-like ATP-grasp enzyme
MPEIRFLGYGLSGKWDVQQMLQKDDDLKGYLPETRFLTSGSELLAWLRERTDVILKPQGGSQGKGVLHVQRVLSVDGDESYSVKGRDAQNVPIERSFCHFQSCWRWLCRIIGQRPYLIQQYLTLHNSKGMSFDIRSLVQKNGRGLWETTGMAVRIGQPGSLTSNLHGGGSVDKVSPFLEREFGASKAQELAAQLKKLSSQIPPALEAHHGRLAELGIDLGIDASGRVWILEVNSKPGRTVFERIRNKKARIKSITNPIRYAEYLLFKKLG